MLCGRAQTVKQIESIMKKNAKIANYCHCSMNTLVKLLDCMQTWITKKQTFTLSGKKNPLTTIHSDVNNCNEPYPQ